MSHESQAEPGCSDRHYDSVAPTLAVVLDGGIVQAVVTDQPDVVNLDIVVIDYDTDGADERELSRVPQGDGTLSDAFVYSQSVETAEIDIEHIVDKAPVS